MASRDTGAWSRGSIQRERARFDRGLRAREAAVQLAPRTAAPTTKLCDECDYRLPIDASQCIRCKAPCTAESNSHIHKENP